MENLHVNKARVKRLIGQQGRQQQKAVEKTELKTLDELAAPSEIQRAAVVGQLESVFCSYGNPTRKNSLEIENSLFEKSRNEVEYQSLASRLLRYMRSMGTSTTEKQFPLFTSCFGSAVNPMEPQNLVTSPENPKVIGDGKPTGIAYEPVLLPMRPESVFVSPMSATLVSPMPATLAFKPDLLEKINHWENRPEVFTTLESVPHDAISKDTVDVTFNLLVPTNAVIKGINVFLKPTAQEHHDRPA